LPSSARPLSQLHLTRGERWALVLCFVAVVLFGAVVEMRSAFLKHRMGDLSVFLRAAWAVRAGQDIYTVTDANSHHYHYPPLLAILLVPLADPPPEADRSGTLPYPVSVGLWYVISLGCLVLAVHTLATALEQTAFSCPDAGHPYGRWQWWALRAGPVLSCLPALGASLVRGQLDPLLLVLLCGMIAAALRGRAAQAGFWLGGAISLKVFPAFLLVVPLWRRDGRWLVGCVAGLVLGLGIVPAAVFGPRQTLVYYREWQEVLLRPALTEGGDQTRARELTQITATDSQSLMATLHNTRYLDRATRPPVASAGERLAHWAAGGLLTLITLLAAGRRTGRDGPAEVIFFGALILVMLLISPVCHLHYFCLSLPILMGLVAASWRSDWAAEKGPRLGTGLLCLLGINLVANALPRFPGLEVLRDVGLAMYAGLLLWLTGCIVLWTGNRARGSLASGQFRPPLAA
jgi:hypothetical protein